MVDLRIIAGGVAVVLVLVLLVRLLPSTPTSDRTANLLDSLIIALFAISIAVLAFAMR